MPNTFEQFPEQNNTPPQDEARMRFLDDLLPQRPLLTRAFDDSMGLFKESVSDYRQSLAALPEHKQLEFHMLINEGKGLTNNQALQERFPNLYKKAQVVVWRYDRLVEPNPNPLDTLSQARIPTSTPALAEAWAKTIKHVRAGQMEAAHTITDLRFLPNDDTKVACTIDKTSMLLRRTFTGGKDQLAAMENLDLFLKRFPHGPALVLALEEVCDLLESPEGKAGTRADLRKVAFQTLRHAARPDEIDQGHHNTCNVTSIEEVLFTHYPQIAAKIIRQAALDGKIGKVSLPLDSLAPGKEEVPLHTADGKRSHASQIFQVATVNWIKSITNPGLRYLQVPPESEGDTGERLLQTNGTFLKENGTELRQPDLSTYDVAMALRSLTGKKDLVMHGLSDDVPAPRAKELTKRLSDMDCLLLRSKDELMNQAELARTTRKILCISTGNAIAPGDGTAHVIVITDADRAHDRIAISNFWGKSPGHDRWVPAADLWKALPSLK